MPSAAASFLNVFHFDDTNNWLSIYAGAPRAFSGVAGVPSWQSNAVHIAGTNARLQYNEIETNGVTNIVCPSGTVWGWFLSDWSSASSGGTGPGAYGRLFELGAYTTNASYGWFSLYLDPKGTNVFFSGQTNGASATYLTASVSLSSNAWTFLALTYSPSNSFLFTNGQLCASGSGVAYYPGPGARTNGFCIGSDSSSSNLAQGQFEWVRTYNYPVSADSVSNFYQMVLTRYGGGSLGPDGPGVPLGGDCVSGGDVYATNLVSTYVTNQGWTVSFNLAGGTNGTPYDIFTVSSMIGSNVTNSQWIWLGQGYTCFTYTFTGQPTNQAFYTAGDATADPDGDGLSTSYERLVSKTDPLAFTALDADGDGLPDAWEIWHALNPAINDAGLDSDGDGLTNLQEYLLGSHPNSSPPFEIFISQPNSLSPLP